MTKGRENLLVCACAHSDVIDHDKRVRVLGALRGWEGRLVVVDDLCRVAADTDPALLKRLGQSAWTVVACYARAVKGLLAMAGVEPDTDRVRFVNLRSGTAEEVLDGLGLSVEEDPDVDEPGLPQAEGDWMPWFPVIDRDRCRDCGQCLEFCLFGVYEREASGTVRVAAPSQCKTYCPACARICPATAVMFPKSEEDAVAGADVTAEEVRGSTGGDLQAALEGDVYKVLGERSARRRGLLDGEAVDRALAERRACSCKQRGRATGAP